MGLSRLLEDSGRTLQLSEVADVLQKDERWKENPKAATILLSELGRSKRMELVQQVLAFMSAQTIQINVFHCSSAASAFEKASEWYRSILVLSEMSRMQVESNAYTQSVLQKAYRGAGVSNWQQALQSAITSNVKGGVCSFVTACASLGGWELIFGLVSKMHALSLSAERVLLGSAAISSLGSYDTASPSTKIEDTWAKALLLLQQMLDPDIVAMGAAMNVCEKGEQWRWAQELFESSMVMNLRPNVITFNSLMSACQKSIAWRVAIHHLMCARSTISPDTLSFNAALSAATAATWQKAIRQLAMMQTFEIQRSNISYNSAMSSDLRWAKCLCMIELMRAATCQTSRITYNATIDATQRTSEWQETAMFLAKLHAMLIKSDVVTYASSISTYAQADEWANVTKILNRMRSSQCSPNTVALTSAICACRVDQWLLAFSLFLQLSMRNLEPNQMTCSNVLAASPSWLQSLGWLNWMGQLGLAEAGRPATATSFTSCAGQHEWQRCLEHSTRGVFDVGSANALASVCYAISQAPLALHLLGVVQLAAMKTLTSKIGPME
eukprot:symbB.v1.2.007979.t1/scaffold496.1/size195705/3